MIILWRGGLPNPRKFTLKKDAKKQDSKPNRAMHQSICAVNVKYRHEYSKKPKSIQSDSAFVKRSETL